MVWIVFIDLIIENGCLEIMSGIYYKMNYDEKKLM